MIFYSRDSQREALMILMFCVVCGRSDPNGKPVLAFFFLIESTRSFVHKGARMQEVDRQIPENIVGN